MVWMKIQTILLHWKIMKGKLFIFVFLFSVLKVASQEQFHALEEHWEPQWEKIRVTSYNVLSAFNKVERKDKLVNWLKQQDPEVSAFQELSMTQKQFADCAKLWGHPYVIILKEKGLSVGISSKKPIEVISKNINFHHGFLHVKTYGIDFIVTHLHPGSWRKRLEEANILVDYINTNKLDSLFLMGDMNAHSPMDADYLENNSVLLPLMRGGINSENFPVGNFDYFAISKLLGTPLLDVIQPFVSVEKRMSFPSHLLMTTSKQDYRLKKRKERIDFIFASPKIAPFVVDGYVFNGRETDYISDHYPVCVDILVDKRLEK